MAPRKRLGQLLIEMGVIDEHQLNSALGHQKQWGGKLGSVLVQKGLCKEADVIRVLSIHLGMPVIHLSEAKIDPRGLKMVTRQVAEKLRVFPVELSGSGRAEVLTIAMAEPSDLSIVDQIAFHTGKRVKPVLTGESEIATAIAFYYSEAQGARTTPISSQVYGTSVKPGTGRPASISQRPAPPHIAPPVMAPVARPQAALSTAPFGQVRPPSGRFSPPLAPAMQKPAAPYVPPPIPAPTPPAPVAQVAPVAPLEEIEPIDLDSIPGMPPAPGSGHESDRMEGLEPIAAHSNEPTSWDEAPSTDAPPSVSWDDSPSEPVSRGPAPVQHEEVGWSEVEFSAPPPVAPLASEPPAPRADSPFGAAQDWSSDAHSSAPGQPAPQTASEEQTADELPADAILGTAEDGEAPDHAAAAPSIAAHETASNETGLHEAGSPETSTHAADAHGVSQETAAEAAITPVAPEQAGQAPFLEAPSFFEAPSDRSIEVAPAPAAATPAAEALAVQPAEPPAEPPAEAPIADPWADLEMPHDDPAQESPFAAAFAAAPPPSDAAAQAAEPAPAASSEGGAIAEAQTAAAPSSEDPHSADAPAAEASQVAPEPPFAAAWAPATAAPARPVIAPGAFASEPGAILAPDAWGEVADPLAGHPTMAQPRAEARAPAAPPPEDAATSEHPISDEFPIVHDEFSSELSLATHAEEQRAAEDQHAAEQHRAAEEQHAEAQHVEEQRAAERGEEQRGEEQHAAEEQRGEEQHAAEEQRAADEQHAAEVQQSEPAPGSHAEQAEGSLAVSEVSFASDELTQDQAAPEEARAASDEQVAEQAVVADGQPAAWLGQGLADTLPLSHDDIETLAGVGIDPSDGMGALRLLAGLLRALAAKQLIDLGELTVDLYSQRTAPAAPASREDESQGQPESPQQPESQGEPAVPEGQS